VSVVNTSGVLDIETAGGPFDGRLLCLGWRTTAHIPPQKIGSPGFDEQYHMDDLRWIRVLEELADPSITKIVWTKYDHRWLILHGIPVNGPVIDVQTMAWVVDPLTALDLGFCEMEYAGYNGDKRIRRVAGRILFECDNGIMVPMAEAPLDKLKAYNERDLKGTHLLFHALKRKLEESGQFGYWQRRHFPYTEVLVNMETTGIPISVWRTKNEAKRLRAEVGAREPELLADGRLPPGFNLNSDQQLASYLFTDEFNWPTQYRLEPEDMKTLKAGEWPSALPLDFEITKVGRILVTGYHPLKGRGLVAKVVTEKCQGKASEWGAPACGHVDEADHQPSVSAKVLKVHHGGDLWVQEYLEWKKRVTGLQFLDAWIEEEHGGRIYGRFNQTGTETGRLSSSGPNLQQVPSRGELGKRFRALFRAPKGRIFIHGDFSQIEPRLMAHLSQDPVMMDIFERGVDIYEEAGRLILNKEVDEPERQLMKTSTMALDFGAKAAKIRSLCAEQGFFLPMSKVERVYKGITKLYHVFFEWKDEQVKLCEERGYVETMGGHRRKIGWVDPDMRWKSENQTVATEVQGSAADIMRASMVEIRRHFPWIRFCAMVHDEVLMEIPEELRQPRLLQEIQEICEVGHGFELTVPMKFEPRFVRAWAEGKA
jgi:DNA polymerase I-like protein with 3'-5' exonuclease and polymerase domains